MRIYLCIFIIFSVSLLVKCGNQMVEECRRETGMIEESLVSDSNDPKAWCVSACVLKKKGIMVNGKAIADKVIEDLTQDMPEIAKDAVKTGSPACVNKANQETDECAVFIVLRDCLIEKRLYRK